MSSRDERSSRSERGEHRGKALALALVLFALLYGVVRIRYAPPSPAPVDAAAERFSALRARELQARVVADGSTRALGTPGNARGREVITAELVKQGWTVETQNARACTHHGMCGPVANVVAVLPGREPSLPGVLLSAHHDSVPVSPGASDDGLGVATLVETARALAQGPRPRRTIIALFTDGEENGLLGASAFVRDHPLATTIRTTVNVDSRGSRGPSQMFETSSGNAWLVALMAGHLERPVTTSLYYEVYRRMPNDTDFSITKTAASGVNFANTYGIENYHTPLDSLAASSLGTLQHHGDHVLGMARAFADTSGSMHAAEGDAVWFDVLAFGLVHWPERWSLLLAVLGLVLVAGQAVRARAFDRGLAVFFPSLISGIAASLVAGAGLALVSAIPAPWVAQPLPALTALHTTTAAGVAGPVILFARRATPRSLWAGTWLGWAILGVVSAAVAPGTSYVFVVPTLIAALVGALGPVVAALAPACAAAVLVLPLAPGVYETLGLKVAPMTALATILLGTTLAPMLGADDLPPPRAKRILGALAVVALIAGVGASIVPKFSAAIPQRANVVFRQDEHSARAFVDTTWGSVIWGEAPAPMLDALVGPRTTEPALPWTLPSPSVEVPRVDLKAPAADTVSVDDDGKRHHVQLRLRSQRGAQTLVLVFPAGRQVEIKVEGRFAVPRRIPSGSLVGLLSVPESGIVVDLESEAPGPIAFTLLDRTSGVVPRTKAEAAVRARPAEAVPSQDGDVTIVTTALSR